MNNRIRAFGKLTVILPSLATSRRGRDCGVIDQASSASAGIWLGKLTPRLSPVDGVYVVDGARLNPSVRQK